MQSLPKVLLLGDSIRGSYQPHVKAMLEGKAEVVGPYANCQYSLYTLSSLDIWIPELGEPQIVHWNNGIHDAGHNIGRFPVQMPIEMYRANLEFILRRLQSIPAKVIWATTTPIHPKFDPLSYDNRWTWTNQEIDRYNEVASELMNANGVPINDLHKVVWENPDEYMWEDKLHLSEAGQKVCAQAVIKAISPYL